LYLMLSTKKEPNCLPPDTISGLKMYPKCFFGRGYVPNPAGGAQALPHAPWPDLGRFTEGKGEREGRGKGWRGAQRRRSESRGTEERGRGRSGRNGREKKGRGWRRVPRGINTVRQSVTIRCCQSEHV